MKIFEELWRMAIPFAIRKKELEYENEKDTKRITGDSEIIQREIEVLTLTCKKDLTILLLLR